jgi:hypothetical protein
MMIANLMGLAATDGQDRRLLLAIVIGAAGNALKSGARTKCNKGRPGD